MNLIERVATTKQLNNYSIQLVGERVYPISQVSCLHYVDGVLQDVDVVSMNQTLTFSVDINGRLRCGQYEIIEDISMRGEN